jgi:hypothetical protein
LAKERNRRASKADRVRVEQRINELVKIRLQGAAFWDVREYVSEKETEDGSPWKVPEGGKPLSERQIRNYVRRADEIICRSGREKRSKAIYRHMAQRRDLYGRAVVAGDIRTALACADSEAKLRKLFPADRLKVTHDLSNLSDEALAAKREALRAKIDALRARIRERAGGGGEKKPAEG